MGSEQINFIELFLGEMHPNIWLFHILLMYMGIMLYVLNRIRSRKDKSTKPSFTYYLSNFDNRVAIFVSIILTYILIRFYSNYQEHLIEQLPTQWKITPYFAMVIIGFYQHKISEFLTKQSKE